jgi:hypothetical protein
MGFLDSGETMTWEEVVFVIDYVKRVSACALWRPV